ncbi:uncharacterized protein LOC110938528 [Helianthus annuus]|uniref:uncharacterized protein LOC110938528 n=1 Tax=Helianthus annuus TaxID=4232 RepID=UPI000B90089C|nr:uncharacterized protein LOC110938528 [Helianthus annuus]
MSICCKKTLVSQCLLYIKTQAKNMGNCIIRQKKIMQTGQEVSEHKESMKVQRVIGGRTYYPVPHQEDSTDLNKDPESEAETEDGNGIVRIKLVITKQELEVMLTKGGVSVSDLVSHMKKDRSSEAVVVEDEDNRSCGRWKPVLDSIPELNKF